MADSKELTKAYDVAMAAMSPKCRFVEWKYYGGGDDVGSWSPFGLTRDRKDSWREIKGARWIYVFQRYARVASAGVWVEELHIEDGNISATPMVAAQDSSGAPLERDKRPHPITIGRTISFARRINGVAMEYFFLATRIRLPAASIQAFGPNIAAFAPPVTFEEDDPNRADYANTPRSADQVFLIAALDPITIALQLNACYIAAADDLINYTTVHEDQSSTTQEEVDKRLRKRLLAQLISALVAPEVDTTNQLVNKLKHGGNDLETFLKEYEAQVAYRITWRDRWASLLARWLHSVAWQLLEQAYHFEPVRDFADYMTHFAQSLHRINESPEGRLLIKALLEENDHWIHKYVLPETRPTETVFQVIRKGGGTALELFTALGPQALVAKMTPKLLVSKINWLAEALRPGAPRAFAKEIPGTVLSTYIEGPYIVQVTEIKVIEDIEFEPRFEGAVTKLSACIEFVNAAIAIYHVADVLSGKDSQQKAIALINLVGAGADFSVSILVLLKKSRKVIAVIGYISALIDTALAIVDAREAYDKDDMGGMAGSAVVAAGSVLAAGATVYTMVTGVSATGVGIAALAIVALGYSIKLVFGDSETDYHKLVGHCEWGVDVGKDSYHPDWAPLPFKDWKGNYDAQLRAAISVLCKFEIKWNDANDLRAARLSSDWIPAGSKMAVTYSEKWETAGKSRSLSDTFVFDQNGPQSQNAQLDIAVHDKTSYEIHPHQQEGKAVRITTGGVNTPEGLKEIVVEARLTIELGTYKFVYPGKPLSRTLFPLTT